MLRLDLSLGTGGRAPMDDSGRLAMRNACNRGVSRANEGDRGGTNAVRASVKWPWRHFELY